MTNAWSPVLISALLVATIVLSFPRIDVSPSVTPIREVMICGYPSGGPVDERESESAADRGTRHYNN
ncbi:MAG: hypothetical protein GC199_09255 [Alphaproteobacteria bacterium]|nr:hypothetical protein [Alphaproteobacteria bacterium]